MIKLSGADWKAFYGDPEIWGKPDASDSKYHEDEEILINGRPQGADDDLSKVQDSDVMTVKSGTIFSNAGGDFEADLVRTLKAWLRARTHERVVLEIPLNEMGKLVKIAKAKKWRIVQ